MRILANILAALYLIGKHARLTARCPFCGSIWVCWNWIHVPLEKLIELNPHLTEDYLKSTVWGHECWKCGDEMGGSCYTTEKKVRNGVPYWLLKLHDD